MYRDEFIAVHTNLFTNQNFTIMKTNQISINPYKTTWAIFTPVTGKYVTKHDRRAITGYAMFSYKTWHEQFFTSKQKALEFINNFSKKLDKKYRVRLLTDKQFAAAKSNGNEMPAFPFTNKQMNEVYHIG